MVESAEKERFSNNQLPKGSWIDGKNTPAFILVPVCLTIPILFLERQNIATNIRSLLESLSIR